MHRSVLAIVSAIVITAVVAIGIGVSAPSNAAVVNGTELGTSVVQSDLEAVAGNSAYLCYLNASALVRSNGPSGLSAVAGASTGTYSSNVGPGRRQPVPVPDGRTGPPRRHAEGLRRPAGRCPGAE